MAPWLDYSAWRGGEPHTVTGTVQVWPELESPQLGNRRHLLVYLPPSYEQGEDRYPVLYMQDGQNLFDRQTSFVGEWQVDETMEALAEEGIEAIVVGIPSLAEERVAEYIPFPDPRFGGGKGEAYLDFLVETIKPLIDRDFRTRPGKEHTGIVGSSLGGVISLYAFFSRPGLFGFVGAMSPVAWVGRGALLRYVTQAEPRDGRIYLDVGTREYAHRPLDLLLFRGLSRFYRNQVRRLSALLAEKGFRPDEDLRYVEEKGGRHHESAWARRLPGALRFLLGDRVERSRLDVER